MFRHHPHIPSYITFTTIAALYDFKETARRRAMPVAIGYESDYGSDIDEDTVAGLIAQEWAETSRPLIIEPIDAVNPLPKVVRIPRAVGSSPDTRHKRKRVTASDDADLLDMASLVDTTAASLLAATGIANAQDNVAGEFLQPRAIPSCLS